MHVPAPASENKPAEHGEHDVWPVLLWYWPAVQREQQALCPPLLVQQFGAVGGPTWPAGQFTHKLTALWYMPDVQSLPAQALAPAPVQNHTRTRTCNHAGHDQGVALTHCLFTVDGTITPVACGNMLVFFQSSTRLRHKLPSLTPAVQSCVATQGPDNFVKQQPHTA